MKIALKAAAFAAAASLAAVAGSAQAATEINGAVVVSYDSIGAPAPAGHELIWNFDDVQNAGYSVAFSGASGTRTGSSSSAAAPPGSTGAYAAVLGGGSNSMTLTTPGIAALSIFMGSPDDYNSILFNFSDDTFERLTGIELAGGDYNGNQGIGRRMIYDFGGKTVTSIVFTSGQNSFEFDNISTLASAVPEPATWAMMIAGFGMAGTAIRRRQKLGAALA